jgi:hypothetical protein
VASNKAPWSELDPETYENMTAVLVSRLNLQAQRIDGSGGDGGRDVQIPRATGPEIFEMKSFTGRMKSKRRTQVKNSLTRAAQHNPVAWHLVVRHAAGVGHGARVGHDRCRCPAALAGSPDRPAALGRQELHDSRTTAHRGATCFGERALGSELARV